MDLDQVLKARRMAIKRANRIAMRQVEKAFYHSISDLFAKFPKLQTISADIGWFDWGRSIDFPNGVEIEWSEEPGEEAFETVEATFEDEVRKIRWVLENFGEGDAYGYSKGLQYPERITATPQGVKIGYRGDAPDQLEFEFQEAA